MFTLRDELIASSEKHWWRQMVVRVMDLDINKSTFFRYLKNTKFSSAYPSGFLLSSSSRGRRRRLRSSREGLGERSFLKIPSFFFYFVYLPRQIKTSLQNFQTLKPIDYFLFIENKTNPTPRPRPFIPSVFIAASFSRRIRMLAIFARLIFGRGVASSTERVGALSENHFFFKILKS